MSEQEYTGPRVTDRRRVDPDSGQVRRPAGPVDAPVVEDPFAAAAVEAERVEADVAGVEARVAELTGDLQRIHAEYANYRKRVDRDRELIRQTAVGSVLADLLVVLDDLDRAREHGELEGAFKAVGDALTATLTRTGLERFGALGEEFDPHQHEAMTHEESDVAVPTIVAVYQPGYRYADRVLRAARVGVAGQV